MRTAHVAQASPLAPTTLAPTNLGQMMFHCPCDACLQACEQDRKLRTCYKKHPKHIVVPNSDQDFSHKLETTTRAVLDIALAVHPQ